MKKIVFTIYGEPVGKGRPRFSRAGKGVRTYTPEKTAEYELAVSRAFRRAVHTGSFEKGTPIDMEITAYFAVPKSVSKKKRAEMLTGQLRPTKKPDADNIAKIICDALNGVAYADDAQVVSVSIEKKWATEPCVIVKIKEVTAGNDEISV